MIGYGAGGRLGIGGTESVCQPTLLESIQHVCIKQVRNAGHSLKLERLINFENFEIVAGLSKSKREVF